MFDDSYFRTTFLRDVEASGGHPIVEVQLLSGHAHRVRSILEVGTGTVTLETYITKGDLAHERRILTQVGGLRSTNLRER